MIRPAQVSDLPRIEEIYAIARRFMAENGNPTQWSGGYPWRDMLEEDIQKGTLFVYEEAGTLHGVFAFVLGDDPTYACIENGGWPNNKPYGTIHRIASDGSKRGVFSRCLAFALERADEIRIDTHRNNYPMQHVLAKHGFQYCGVIYVEDGTPRKAYQYSRPV